MMRYVIFGAGTWGRRLNNSIKMYNGHEAVAFIDNNPEKQGKFFEDLPVISIEEYKENYSDCIIIIATIFKDSVETIKNILHKNNVYIYFNMRDCPWDFFRQFEGKNFPLDEAISEIYPLIRGKQIGISEMNLFGILLYDYLKSKQQDVVFLVNKDFDMNDPLAKELLKSYDIITYEDVSGGG